MESLAHGVEHAGIWNLPALFLGGVLVTLGMIAIWVNQVFYRRRISEVRKSERRAVTVITRRRRVALAWATVLVACTSVVLSLFLHP